MSIVNFGTGQSIAVDNFSERQNSPDPLKSLRNVEDLYAFDSGLRVLPRESSATTPHNLLNQSLEIGKRLRILLNAYQKDNFETSELTAKLYLNFVIVLDLFKSDKYPNIGLTQLGTRLLGEFSRRFNGNTTNSRLKGYVYDLKDKKYYLPESGSGLIQGSFEQ